MPKSATPEWAVQYTQVIAKQVRNHRNLCGMSAQQLSDRCAELGMTLPRAVISNLECGRRENVTVSEVFCIARALKVAPIDLLTAPDGETEVAPRLSLARTAAAGWIAGAPDPEALNTAATDLARAQADAERAHRTVQAAARHLADLLGPDRAAEPLGADRAESR